MGLLGARVRDSGLTRKQRIRMIQTTGNKDYRKIFSVIGDVHKLCNAKGWSITEISTGLFALSHTKCRPKNVDHGLNLLYGEGEWKWHCIFHGQL